MRCHKAFLLAPTLGRRLSDFIMSSCPKPGALQITFHNQNHFPIQTHPPLLPSGLHLRPWMKSQFQNMLLFSIQSTNQSSCGLCHLHYAMGLLPPCTRTSEPNLGLWTSLHKPQEGKLKPTEVSPNPVCVCVWPEGGEGGASARAPLRRWGGLCRVSFPVISTLFFERRSH